MPAVFLTHNGSDTGRSHQGTQSETCPAGCPASARKKSAGQKTASCLRVYLAVLKYIQLCQDIMYKSGLRWTFICATMVSVRSRAGQTAHVLLSFDPLFGGGSALRSSGWRAPADTHGRRHGPSRAETPRASLHTFTPIFEGEHPGQRHSRHLQCLFLFSGETYMKEKGAPPPPLIVCGNLNFSASGLAGTGFDDEHRHPGRR